MFITIATDSPTHTSAGPRSGRRAGSLCLMSPTSPMIPNSPMIPQSPMISKGPTILKSPYVYLPPGPSDSRSPCPALNTLANHGYLPRDGKDIHVSKFLEALQHQDTYHLSDCLAKILTRFGALLTEDSLRTKFSALFTDSRSLSLHDLAVHKHDGVEHDASVIHKNAAKGARFAPTRADSALVDYFLGDRQTIDLAHVAHSRMMAELVSELDGFHAEIARGEWALVLDIFGHAYGGNIPAGMLRTWLKENRFPEQWKPDHEQTFLETVETSTKIRHAMAELRKSGTEKIASEEEIRRLAAMMESVPVQDETSSTTIC